MKSISIFQVDAFTDVVFGGNPAAVCPLDKWLPCNLLQLIAAENNLSETAFFVEQEGALQLRWFTPRVEVDLCGHATLASAHVLFEHMNYEQDAILFETNSGTLTVVKSNERLLMDFPSVKYREASPPDRLVEALGARPTEVYQADDFMCVYDSREQVEELAPDFRKLAEVETRGVIVTAPGEEKSADFVSRFFAPAVGIDEDPVTGSAHCMLTPYWARRLGKKTLCARQVSERGGELFCSQRGDRIEISGRAVTYLAGSIEVPGA